MLWGRSRSSFSAVGICLLFISVLFPILPSTSGTNIAPSPQHPAPNEASSCTSSTGLCSSASSSIQEPPKNSKNEADNDNLQLRTRSKLKQSMEQPAAPTPTPPLLMLRGTRWGVDDTLFFGRRLTISERQVVGDKSVDSHEAKTGLTVWDACQSIALAKYLEHASERFGGWKGKRVIEIGSGCGLVGIALAQAGAKVVLTDLAEVLPSLENNIQANKPLQAASSSDSFYFAKAVALPWGQDEIDASELFVDGFDYIVASDVIWLDYLVEPLVKTLTLLMTSSTTPKATTTTTTSPPSSSSSSSSSPSSSTSDEGGISIHHRREILLAHETRSRRVEDRFFEAMKESGFEVEEIPFVDLPHDRRARDIHIYRIFLSTSGGSTASYSKEI